NRRPRPIARASPSSGPAHRHTASSFQWPMHSRGRDQPSDYPRKFAVQNGGLDAVSCVSFLRVIKFTEIVVPPILLDLGLPLAADLAPSHPFEARRVVGLRGPIALVLRPCCGPEIAESVVVPDEV